jgi:hypothetical protein
MNTNSKNYINLPFVVLAALVVAVFGIQQSFANVGSNGIIELGEETKKADCLAEAVYWPNFDFNDVKASIVEPNITKKNEFIKLVNQIVEPNNLTEELTGKIRFLKGWRGESNENFVVQYEMGPYLIRIKNQATTVVATRKWTSYWLTMVIQLKDKTLCVNKSDLDAIFNFTDRFLSKKVNSKAQNYSGMKNVDGTDMVRPIFTQLDNGCYIVYPVQSSHPDIDGVIIWTDGHTVIINLQERRKVIIQE